MTSPVSSRNAKAAIGAVIILLSLGAVSNLRAQFIIDFDLDDAGAPLVSGTTDLRIVSPYDNLFGVGQGVDLSTSDPTNHPLNLYDTETVGGFDPDLERNSTGSGLWDGGTESATVFNNVLMVNEFSNISIVDDEGTGGDIILNFDVPLTSFGFDFVDMDSGAGASLILTDTSTFTDVVIPFTDFEDGSGSIHEVTGALFGDRHANTILDIRASEVGLTKFDRVTFDLDSSGGIGAAYLETVPEPGSALLMVVAGSALLFRRCRRSVAA